MRASAAEDNRYPSGRMLSRISTEPQQIFNIPAILCINKGDLTIGRAGHKGLTTSTTASRIYAWACIA